MQHHGEGSRIRSATLGYRDASALLGISQASLRRHRAAGLVPAPLEIGGRVLWLEAELLAWLDAGCPDRKTWEERPMPLPSDDREGVSQ